MNKQTISDKTTPLIRPYRCRLHSSEQKVTAILLPKDGQPCPPSNIPESVESLNGVVTRTGRVVATFAWLPEERRRVVHLFLLLLSRSS